MVNSSGVRGRVAVRADLSFGDPPKSQADEREKEAKFKGALEAVAEREERRRRRPNNSPDGTATEEGKEAPRGPAPGAPAAARPGRVMAQSPNALDARRRALLDKVPAAPRTAAARSVAVPREIAEAVTDPRMAAPPRELLVTPQESTAPFGDGSMFGNSPLFDDMETGGLDAMGESPHTDPTAPAPNAGDGTSLPMLEEDDFFELDVDESEMMAEAGAQDEAGAVENHGVAGGTADGHPLSRRR